MKAEYYKHPTANEYYRVNDNDDYQYITKEALRSGYKWKDIFIEDDYKKFSKWKAYLKRQHNTTLVKITAAEIFALAL